MAGFVEYDQYDAVGLAKLVREKKISPAELCEEAINRIEKLNPILNAVINPMFDMGRETVKKSLPDGPFTGVPFLLKDLISAYSGVKLTSGCRAYKDYIPDYDSELVKRFKKSGLIALGKTNTPEFGLMGITEPELYGPTRNPWNIEHTPGGSSGGSAAAVASGMVPMASGGDGGGSIRIPSAFCALFGLKPTRGRTPTGPKYGELWQGAAIEHVLTRSVRDNAAMLDAICGADVGAPYIIKPPERPYTDEINCETGSLKIAFNTESPLGTGTHEYCKEAVLQTAKLLQDLGHNVEEARPELDGIRLANSYFTLYFGEIAADIELARSVLKKKVSRSDFEIATWFFGQLGHHYTAFDFVRAMREWDIAARVMGQFHLKYDLFLTPTVAAPPAKIGELLPKSYEKVAMKILSVLNLGFLAKASGMVNQIAIQTLAKTPFTQLANFTGQPAMNVPLQWDKKGMPCGVQFIAPFGDEATLFRLASQLEKVKPWFDKRPELKV
ncbi:MAG: amidase [Deltaproteobacteria bacterium HGW-Deltaproteobacteria-2]|jgi:amidase|nr:MAG: amidase [Deltaproteobacteria bacterium HGW-Deltaproteobacteria-2]